MAHATIAFQTSALTARAKMTQVTLEGQDFRITPYIYYAYSALFN